MLKAILILFFLVPAHSSVELSKKAISKMQSITNKQDGEFSMFGSADGGGVDFDVMMGKDSWFTQSRDEAPKSVRYCIEMNISKTNLDENKIEEVFNKNLKQWFDYIKKFNVEKTFLQVPVYVKNYERVDQCSSTTDLRIVYGEPNQTVKEILSENEWTGMKLAHAKAIDFKGNQFQRKAVIWISGRLNNHTLSDEEAIFEALLKHEFGHSLGVKHTPASIMTNALGVALLFRGFVTEEHFKYIVSKLEIGGSLVALSERERLFGDEESKGNFGFVNDSGQNQNIFYKLTGEKIPVGAEVKSIVKSSSSGSHWKEWVLKVNKKEYPFVISPVQSSSLRVSSLSLAIFNFSRRYIDSDGEEGHYGSPYPSPEIDLVQIQQNFGKAKVFYGEVLNGVWVDEVFDPEFNKKMELVENAQLVMQSAHGQFPLHRVYKLFDAKKIDSTKCLNFYCLGKIEN